MSLKESPKGKFGVLKRVPEKERFSQDIKPDVEAKTVEAYYSVRPQGGWHPYRYLLGTLVDFGNCSQEDILKFATRELIREFQKIWWDIAKVSVDKAARTDALNYIDVYKDIMLPMVERRRRTDPAASAIETIAKKKGWSEDTTQTVIDQLMTLPEDRIKKLLDELGDA